MAATYSDDVPEQEGTGVEAGDVGYRGQSDVHLTKRDLEDAEFFGSLAAHFVSLGVKPTVAWERALEWIRDNPDDLPAGFEWPAPAPPAPSNVAKLEFVTPHARRAEQLEDVERFVPHRERGSSVRVGLAEDDDDQELELDEQDHAPRGEARAARNTSGRASGPAPFTDARESSRAALRPKSRTSTTPALSPEKGSVMARGDTQKALFKAILSGPKTTAELIALKLTTPGSTMATLATLKKKGAIANDGQGEPWRILKGGGFEAWLEKRNEEREKTNGHAKPKTIADVAAKHATKKPARKPSARKSPPPAAPVTPPAPSNGLADAFETMRAALKADFERKMAALDVLAGK